MLPGGDASEAERPGGAGERPVGGAGERPVGGAGERPVLAECPDFLRLFAGNTVSLLGSSVTTVALPLTAVVHLGASAGEMGVLGALALVPHLVLGLPAGVWVDRLPYRRVVVLADAVRVVLLGAPPLLAVLGALRMWHLYVVVTLAGVAGLFESVAAQSFTPKLVPRDRLPAANSTLMLSNATVGTTGSAVGGLLVSALTAPVAIAVDAASFAVSALVKSRIRTDGRLPEAERRTPERGRLPGARPAKEIGEGLRAVFGHPVMRAVFLAATVGAFAVLLLAQVLKGAGPSLYGVNQQTFRQILIPAGLLSRANATWRFLAYGGQSLGALAGGAAGALLGLKATLVVTSCLMLAGTGIGLFSPVRGLRRLPDG